MGQAAGEQEITDLLELLGSTKPKIVRNEEDDSVDLDFYFVQARSCIKQGRYHDALDYCEDALREDPMSAYAMNLKVQAYLSMGEIAKAQVILGYMLTYFGDKREVGFAAMHYIERMLEVDEFADVMVFFLQYKDKARATALGFIGMACTRYAEAERKSVKELDDKTAKREALLVAERVFLEAIDYLKDSPIFLIQAIEGLLYVYLEWSKKFEDKTTEMQTLLAQAESFGIKIPPRIYAAFVFQYVRKLESFDKAVMYLVKCCQTDMEDQKTVQAMRAFRKHLKEHRKNAANVPDRELKIVRLEFLASVCNDVLHELDDSRIIISVSINLSFIYLEISRMAERSCLSEMLQTLLALEMLVSESQRKPEMYLPLFYYFTQVRKDQGQADLFLQRCEQYISSDEKEYLEPAYAAYKAAFGTSFGIDQST